MSHTFRSMTMITNKSNSCHFTGSGSEVLFLWVLYTFYSILDANNNIFYINLVLWELNQKNYIFRKKHLLKLVCLRDQEKNEIRIRAFLVNHSPTLIFSYSPSLSLSLLRLFRWAGGFTRGLSLSQHQSLFHRTVNKDCKRNQ